MSEEGFDKTEQPTQRRRDEARARGQFAYSQELIHGLLLLGGVLGLWWSGSALASTLNAELQWRLRTVRVHLSMHEAPGLLVDVLNRGLGMISGLLLMVFAVGLFGGFAQAGLHFHPESLGPKWDKINPASNWSKIFSQEGLIRGGAAILKVCLVGAAAWWVLGDRGEEIALLGSGALGQAVSQSWGLSLELMLTTAGLLFAIGLADYGWQWYRTEKMLRMSREELKRERKDDEGDPQIQLRRRQRARELASQRRMLDEVARATLVVTNPTHLAVALRYERGVTGAPVVVAKGQDQFAFQIAARARRHGIPVVQRKPVAQALFKMVRVGQEIPQALFVAVSEVLAYVYRLKGLSA